MRYLRVGWGVAIRINEKLIEWLRLTMPGLAIFAVTWGILLWHLTSKAA